MRQGFSVLGLIIEKMAISAGLLPSQFGRVRSRYTYHPSYTVMAARDFSTNLDIVFDPILSNRKDYSETG